MHKKTSFAKRVMSLLLVTVMVLGMLPGITLPVSADVSLNGVANPDEFTGGTSKYGFTYDPDGNCFTRFTLVKIDTDDNDSVKSGQITEGTGLDGCTTLFSTDEALKLGHYQVIASVDIGSTTHPVKSTAEGAIWFDTNAIGYQEAAVSADAIL